MTLAATALNSHIALTVSEKLSSKCNESAGRELSVCRSLHSHTPITPLE